MSGAIVAAGEADAPAVAEVVDVVDKPAGTVAHLKILPSTMDDYQQVKRAASSA